MVMVLWRAVRGWLAEHFAPVRARIRDRGLLRALPVTIAFGVIWLVAGVLSVLPATGDAIAELVQYRGADLTDGHAWRMLLSIFGSYHLGQALWAGVLNTVFVLAPLEARVGSAYPLVIMWAGHLLPSLGAFAVLSLAGLTDWLERLDYGSSAALMAAVAALAVLRRSWVITAVMAFGLVGDAFFSDHLTAAEHWSAAAIGALLGLLALRRGHRRPASGEVHEVRI